MAHEICCSCSLYSNSGIFPVSLSESNSSQRSCSLSDFRTSRRCSRALRPSHPISIWRRGHSLGGGCHVPQPRSASTATTAAATTTAAAATAATSAAQRSGRSTLERSVQRWPPEQTVGVSHDQRRRASHTGSQSNLRHGEWPTWLASPATRLPRHVHRSIDGQHGQNASSRRIKAVAAAKRPARPTAPPKCRQHECPKPGCSRSSGRGGGCSGQPGRPTESPTAPELAGLRRRRWRRHNVSVHQQHIRVLRRSKGLCRSLFPDCILSESDGPIHEEQGLAGVWPTW